MTEFLDRRATDDLRDDVRAIRVSLEKLGQDVAVALQTISRHEPLISDLFERVENEKDARVKIELRMANAEGRAWGAAAVFSALGAGLGVLADIIFRGGIHLK